VAACKYKVKQRFDNMSRGDAQLRKDLDAGVPRRLAKQGK